MSTKKMAPKFKSVKKLRSFKVVGNFQIPTLYVCSRQMASFSVFESTCKIFKKVLELLDKVKHTAYFEEDIKSKIQNLNVFQKTICIFDNVILLDEPKNLAF